MKITAFNVLLFFLFVSCSTSRKNEVYFIPTLHKNHKLNPNYSYDSLRMIVARLNPDIIAVEIRQEDMAQDSAYLAGSYPYEMRMMMQWFPNTQVKGFDWLGDEFAGKQLSDDLWETHVVEQLERQLNQDSVYSAKMKQCHHRLSERLRLLTIGSLQQLMESSLDEEIVKDYYACLKAQLSGSIYEGIIEFYAQRDEHILKNMEKIIDANKGKRIVILAGDDHYQMLKNRLPHNPLYP